MKRERNSISNGGSSAAAAGKAKMQMQQQQQQPQVDGGMDELFAVLGYKVKSSEMADVAEKLEQLEMAMGTTAADDTSLLSTDTVHYNPSDLSGWLESMLSEFGTYQNLPSQIGDSSGANPTSFANDDDLRAIPGEAIFGNKHKDCGNDSESDNSNNNNKRMRSSEVASAAAAAARPLVLVDSQETGVRLVHTLLACAEAVQQGDMKLADALLKHVGVLAVSQAGAMRKVATCFAEGLARNIYKIFPQESVESSYSDILQSHFYEAGPYMKFAHFTANQAILEAFQGESRVHVIDFSLKQGMQWPVLMQALALRTGGPPLFRLTGIGPPQHDNSDKLHEVGLKLGQLAETIGIQFEFRGFVVNSLADLDANLLDIRDAEAVAVNSVLEIHRVLARPGAIDRVLGSIRAMRPKIVTIVEQEANHNDDVFLTRFNEALHYYSTMFDSLESSEVSNGQDLVMTEVYLGRQICNVVACEGPERVERHETLAQWRQRMCSAGFDPVHLGSNAFKQASMLLELFGGADGYKVEESEGCLMLGWHTRPLVATSAWRLKAAGE